jgi:biopolymer transport protein ExbB
MALTSVTGLTFIVERGIALRWTRVVPKPVVDAANSCRTPQDRPMLRSICEQSNSPLARLLRCAEENLEQSREENEGAVQTMARREMVNLERGLVVLEIVVGIAPLLGLVGTIYGMMTLFGGLGETGLADSGILAKGISLILRFTMAGLLIAIPSLISWNYYNKKVEMLAVELESICADFLRHHYQARPVRK